MRQIPPPALQPRAAPVIVVVAVIVALEVLVLAGVVGLYVVELVGGAPADVGGAVATAVIAGAVAVGLAVCVRGLLAGRRWSRAPMLTWQLFQIVLAAPLVRGPLWWSAVALVLMSLTAGTCLVSRAVVRAIGDEEPPPAL